MVYFCHPIPFLLFFINFIYTYVRPFTVSYIFYDLSYLSFFSSNCDSIFLIVLSSSPPILYSIASNLLSKIFIVINLIYFIFLLKIYSRFSFIVCNYLVKISIFSFTFSQSFIFFCWALNYSYFSVFIRTLGHLWSAIILLFYFVLSFDKHYVFIECHLFYSKMSSGLCFLQKYFFFF